MDTMDDPIELEENKSFGKLGTCMCKAQLTEHCTDLLDILPPWPVYALAAMFRICQEDLGLCPSPEQLKRKGRQPSSPPQDLPCLCRGPSNQAPKEEDCSNSSVSTPNR